MTTKPYLHVVDGRQSPLGTIQATGTPSWVDGRLTFGDYRPLADAHKQWLDAVPAHHRVMIDATVSTDGFVTSTLRGYATYSPPWAGEDPAEFGYCGDGCCAPSSDRDEQLTLGRYGSVLTVEERDDVVTHLHMTAVLHGPAMATFQLAHPLIEGDEWISPGTVLTRPLPTAEQLDLTGRVARAWRAPKPGPA